MVLLDKKYKKKSTHSFECFQHLSYKNQWTIWVLKLNNKIMDTNGQQNVKFLVDKEVNSLNRKRCFIALYWSCCHTLRCNCFHHSVSNIRTKCHSSFFPYFFTFVFASPFSFIYSSVFCCCFINIFHPNWFCSA